MKRPFRIFAIALVLGSVLLGGLGCQGRSRPHFRPGPGIHVPPPPPSRPDGRHAQLRALIQQRASLQQSVVHYTGQVAYWQSEVASRPQSLVAPVGLSSARQSLSTYQSRLAQVDAQIRALGGW